MITSVLFVDSDAEALGRIQSALEQAGRFEAKVFITGRAALEFARQKPPSAAVIALNIHDMSPALLANRLRTLKPGLPIILRVPTDAPREDIEAVGTSIMFKGPYSTRTLIPLLEDATVQLKTAPKASKPPDTPLAEASQAEDAAESAATDKKRSSDQFKSLVDSMAAPAEQPSLLKRRTLKGWPGTAPEPDEPAPPLEEDTTFRKLAEEEPPMPELDENGTVGDLIAFTDPDFADTPDPEILDIPDELIQDLGKIVDDDIDMDLLAALAAAGPVMPPAPQPLQHEPPATAHELIPMPDEVRDRIITAQEESFEPDRTDGGLAVEPEFDNGISDELPDNLTTLALQLTQHTVESTAQATILLKDDRVLATAGELPESDITALANGIDCEAVLDDGVTKIKFVALPQSQANYMVVAAPTIAKMVLVMVFGQNMHLRVIRQQARQLLSALAVPGEDAEEESQPEDSDEPAFTAVLPVKTPVLPPVAAPSQLAALVPAAFEADASTAAVRTLPVDPLLDTASYVKYACAWILNDPSAELNEALMKMLAGWLEEVANTERWLVEYVDVQPDYVSIVIGVPPGETASDVARTLLTSSAERILDANPDMATENGSLWADAYYLVAPGRPLSNEEISEFIGYQREAS